MKTNETCPNCKKEKLEIHPACCEDRARGMKLVKKCPKCGYKEKLV